jgi:hypothetical protein
MTFKEIDVEVKQKKIAFTIEEAVANDFYNERLFVFLGQV